MQKEQERAARLKAEAERDKQWEAIKAAQRENLKTVKKTLNDMRAKLEEKYREKNELNQAYNNCLLNNGFSELNPLFKDARDKRIREIKAEKIKESEQSINEEVFKKIQKNAENALLALQKQYAVSSDMTEFENCVDLFLKLNQTTNEYDALFTQRNQLQYKYEHLPNPDYFGPDLFGHKSYYQDRHRWT